MTREYVGKNDKGCKENQNNDNKINKTKLVYELKGNLDDTMSIQQLKKRLLIQPVVAFMTLPPCLISADPKHENTKYKKGVFIPTQKCPCTSSPNHYATIVGFETNLNGEPKEVQDNCSGYWIVSPSLGEGFGEKGHIHLCIRKLQPGGNDNFGVCLVQTFISWPEIVEKT